MQERFKKENQTEILNNKKRETKNKNVDESKEGNRKEKKMITKVEKVKQIKTG